MKVDSLEGAMKAIAEGAADLRAEIEARRSGELPRRIERDLSAADRLEEARAYLATLAEQCEGPTVTGFDPSPDERTVTLRWPSGNVHSYDRVDFKSVDWLEARNEELLDLLRSAHCIAVRQGESTAWQRFAASCAKLGAGAVTARTYRILPSDEPDAADSLAEQAKPSEGCRCQTCNELYNADVLVPDDVWRKIADGKNMLCPTCIAERIVARDIWTAIRASDIDAEQAKPVAWMVRCKLRDGDWGDWCAMEDSSWRPDEVAGCFYEYRPLYTHPAPPSARSAPSEDGATTKLVDALRGLFDDVRELTINHDEIGGFAAVTADRLEEALTKVNQEWWKDDAILAAQEKGK